MTVYYSKHYETDVKTVAWEFFEGKPTSPNFVEEYKQMST